MSVPGNIVITGFMGTGKSTVGEIVAERLGRQFVDMDAVIEARSGITIAQLFAEQGETAFRAIERDLAHELALQSDLVIATGGGTLVQQDLREVMGRAGTLICLNASKDEIRDRLADTAGRPLAPSWETLAGTKRGCLRAYRHTGGYKQQISRRYRRRNCRFVHAADSCQDSCG